MWPACLLDAHPLPIILLCCALLGPLPACRPKEAFLGASSSHKSDNLSALLTTQPHGKTEGDIEIGREAAKLPMVPRRAEGGARRGAV